MVSGSVNVVLLFCVVYLVMRPSKIQFEKRAETVEALAVYERTNGELLRQLRRLSFENLTEKLQDQTLVENGYTVRDLSLAAMVSFHALDVERALGKMSESRSLVIGKRQNGSYLTVTAFPGMNDSDFEKIKFFIQTEKWPQNAFGLYTILKKQAPLFDASLKEAFMMTLEAKFMAKFMQGTLEISSDELIALLLDSDWKTVVEMARKKETGAILRQQYLIRLIEKKSKIAAMVFLKVDSHYAAFRLDDVHLVMLLNLVEPKSPHAELLSKRVLASPRSDAVLAAAKKLKPDLTKEISFKEPLSPSIYVVQEGDNLWKISRRFKVDIDKIKKQNRLESDTLKPGTSLTL